MSRFFARVPAVRVCVVGAALAAAGCVKDIPSEERLDRATADIQMTPGITPEELAKINCDDAGAELATARDVNRPETERVRSYMKLYDSLQKRTKTFEDAFARNPDLSYDPTSAHFTAARDTCVQQTADVRLEFETYTRELVDVPTVQEIKGGNSITVARLDFDTLREAIELIAPDDKDALLNKIASAEKRIQSGTKRSGR